LSKVLDITPRQAKSLLPRLLQYLTEAGENIRLAWLRRKLSTTQIAERAAISRSTLLAVEKGAPNVSIGTYLQLLFTLGLEKTILRLAEDDVLGRELQDAELAVKERAPKRIEE
jgi:transcriptional regulator with XRE-family HTH domain